MKPDARKGSREPTVPMSMSTKHLLQIKSPPEV